MLGYFLIYIAIAIWLYRDASRRLYKGLPWAICTAIFGPLVVPLYLAKRPLKAGEVREGGLAWNILKNFALFWTLTMVIAFIAGMVSASNNAPDVGNDAEQTGYAVGTAIGGIMMFLLWFLVTAGALVLGIFLKKSTVIEKGPTGALLAGSPSEHYSTPAPATADVPAKWYYAGADGQAKGPFSFDELRRRADEGTIQGDTFVVQEGGEQWERLRAVLPPRIPPIPMTPEQSAEA